MTTAQILEHEVFCLPPAGEPEPRVERYVQSREDDEGRPIARVLTTRCQDCGAAVYTEV
jgi:hypothetical protein